MRVVHNWLLGIDIHSKFDRLDILDLYILILFLLNQMDTDIDYLVGYIFFQLSMLVLVHSLKEFRKCFQGRSKRK